MDFRDASEANMATDTLQAGEEATTTVGSGAPAGSQRKPYPLDVDHSRDALLTDFGKETLQDRYLLPGESYQDLFVRVASA